MAQITTAADIKQLGTIMGIWAHPDDESFYMASLAATAIRQGQEVICITATHGEAGVRDESRWPAKRLGTIRTRELERAMQLLGVHYHYWLNYADGGCDCVPTSTAVTSLVTLIKKHHPDTILTFGPEGMTGHTDHRTVSQWATKAWQESGITARLYHAVHVEEQYEPLTHAHKQFNIFFNIEHPPLVAIDKCKICYRAKDNIIDLKCRCLRAMPSQTAGLFEIFGKERLMDAWGTEAYVEASSTSSP